MKKVIFTPKMDQITKIALKVTVFVSIERKYIESVENNTCMCQVIFFHIYLMIACLVADDSGPFI